MSGVVCVATPSPSTGAVDVRPLRRPSSMSVKPLAAISVPIFSANSDRPFWTSSAESIPAMNDHSCVPISGAMTIGISAEGTGFAPSIVTAFSAPLRPISSASKSAHLTVPFW
jgi:hypothetical protein